MEGSGTAVMRVEIPAIFFFIHAYYGFHRATATYAEVRVDDNKEYFSHQEIVRAFKESSPAWVYGHNIKTHEVDQKIIQIKNSLKNCIYFNTDSANSTDTKFSRHDVDGNETKTTPLFGKFFTTPGRGKNSELTNRTKPNGVNVSSSFGGPVDSSYKLVYSDYKDCALIRPFTFTHDSLRADHQYSSYPDVTGVCIMLLSDSAARKMNEKDGEPVVKTIGKELPRGLSERLPWKCRLFYPQACGAEPFTVIFQQTCPKIPNPLGC